MTHKIKRMKNFSSLRCLTALITIAFFLVPVLAIAQDPGGGPDVPIDGGLSLLAAAGVAYGVKKYREHTKKGSGDSGMEDEVEK